MNAMQWIADQDANAAAIRERYSNQPIQQWAESGELIWGTHIVWDYTVDYSANDPRQERSPGWCYVLTLVDPRTGERSYEYGPAFTDKRTAQYYGYQNLMTYGIHVIPA